MFEKKEQITTINNRLFVPISHRITEAEREALFALRYQLTREQRRSRQQTENDRKRNDWQLATVAR